MLFKRKTCEKCGTKYDTTAEECPRCHQIDGNFQKLGLPKSIAWLSIWQQIALFLVGFVYGGYLIFQLFFASLFKDIIQDKNEFVFVVICSTYLLLFVTLFFICFPRRKQTIKHFKKWDNYLYGIGYAVTLYAFSNLCGIISIYGLGASTNVNQTNLISSIGINPLISILVMGIIGPICEELTYRVGLFSFLRRLNKYLAFVVTILVFASIHLSFDEANFINEMKTLPTYICGGLILCLAYEHKGPACSITAHVVYNTFSLLLTLTQL